MVQRNLKNIVSMKNPDALEVQDLIKSAKKKRVKGADGQMEPLQKIRCKQESNLRRRIYDAWNVLKAVSIIIEHDNEKQYRYNPAVL